MKLYSYITLAFSIVITSSCTERFELDPEQSVRLLAIEADLTNELRVHTVKITEAKRVTDNTIPYVPGANVRLISSKGDTIKYIEDVSNLGTYNSPTPIRGEAGVVYELLITDIDYDYDGKIDTTRAIEIMPNLVILDSISINKLNLPQIETVGWVINCYALDPPEDNYYLFKAWKNDTLITDTLYEYGIVRDILFNGNYTNGVQTIFLDINKDDEIVRPGDNITLALCNITSSNYGFFSQAKQESRTKVPVFGGPPANITTNFSGNILGCFEVYAVSKQSTIAPPDISH